MSELVHVMPPRGGVDFGLQTRGTCVFTSDRWDPKSESSTLGNLNLDLSTAVPGQPIFVNHHQFKEKSVVLGIKQFELLEDLKPESKAEAVLLTWDGHGYVRSKEKIELHDSVRTHGDRGDRGYCFFSEESNRWESLSGLYQQVSDREF